MGFHLFVACCVYAVAMVFGFICLTVITMQLCDPRYRAQLRRKIRRRIVKILKKFIKD